MSSVNTLAKWEKVHGRGKGFGADVLVHAGCIVLGDADVSTTGTKAPEAAALAPSHALSALATGERGMRSRGARAADGATPARLPAAPAGRPATPADWSSSGTPPSGDSDGEGPFFGSHGRTLRQGEATGAPLGLRIDSDAIPIGGRGTDRFSLSVHIDAAAAVANVPAVAHAVSSGAPLRLWLSYRIFGVLVQSDAFEDPDAPSFRPMRDVFALQASRSDLLRFLRAQPPLPVHLCAPGAILATAHLPLAQLLAGSHLAADSDGEAVVDWPPAGPPPAAGEPPELCVVRGAFPLLPPGTPFTAARMLGCCLRGALVLSEHAAAALPSPAPQRRMPSSAQMTALHPPAAITGPPSVPTATAPEPLERPAEAAATEVDPASSRSDGAPTNAAAAVLTRAAEAATALVEQLGDAARAEAEEASWHQATRQAATQARGAAAAAPPPDADDDKEEKQEAEAGEDEDELEEAEEAEGAQATGELEDVTAQDRSDLVPEEPANEQGREEADDQEAAYAGDASVRHFRLSIEVRSVRDVSSAGQLYAKCSLPELGRGAEHELRTRPSIFVPRHAERLLPSPFKAFEFAAMASELADWATRRPLEVELWRADRFRDDSRVGLARIDMGRLLRARPHFRCSQTGATFVSQAMLDQHTMQLRAAAASAIQAIGGADSQPRWDSPAVLVRAADSYNRAVAFASDSAGGGERQASVASQGEPRVVESCSVRVVLFLEDLGALDDEAVASGAGIGECLRHKPTARAAPVIPLSAAADEAVAADTLLAGSGAGGQPSAALSGPISAARPVATTSAAGSTAAAPPAAPRGPHSQYGGAAGGYARGSPPFGRAGEGVRALEARVDAAVAEAVEQAQADFVRWREREESALAASLRRREAELRARLEEEFAQREEERRAELAAARTHVDGMERQLKKAIVAAEKRARDAAAARKEAEREIASAQREAERESRRARETAEAMVAVERRKVADALEAVRAERAMREAEAARRAEAEQRAVETMARASEGPNQALQSELAMARVRAEAALGRQAALEKELEAAQAACRTARAQALRLAREVQRLREAERLAAAQEVSKLRVEYLAREQRFAMEGDLARLRSIRRRVEALKAAEVAQMQFAPAPELSGEVQESKSAEFPARWEPHCPAACSEGAAEGENDEISLSADREGAVGDVRCLPTAGEQVAHVFSSGRITALRAQRDELLRDGYLQDDELVRNLDVLISVAASAQA